ncbi:hypothetical protein PZ938_08635 [Luteipulveratus sp. YIM 133132]|uniref:hypothetical protein n=1 Tax=Luteipulveratus flavus TaxID=3031728 RepID=UPI0023AE8A57|nr:hypothetical protein [Luteipulveratus sp. YIM 133132]MDE9365669.1 hypothetical protein [Luteipulveratus sp. YIM 133132]
MKPTALVLVLALALLTGCGSEPSSGGGSGAAEAPTNDLPSSTTPSVSVPPDPATTGGVTRSGPGDGPPNHADNNAWKHRPELTAPEAAQANAAASRVRTSLSALRARHEYSPEAARKALASLGFDPDRTEVVAIRPMAGTDDVPPGAAFGIHTGGRGCVIGDIRPEWVRVDVDATVMEGTCLEPFSH